MKVFIYAIKKIWYFCWGNIFFWILYEPKYRESVVFKGKLCGINSRAWEFVVQDWLGRFFLGRNRGIPFLVSPNITIANYKNIEFDIDDIYNFMGSGSYFQAWDAKIVIGKGTWIAQNVGLITSNHDLEDLSKRGKSGDIVLGKNCWIGMNAVILPGVHLGEHTIVGAGAVVTRSFEEGHCVIAGNPAKLIKKL